MIAFAGLEDTNQQLLEAKARPSLANPKSNFNNSQQNSAGGEAVVAEQARARAENQTLLARIEFSRSVSDVYDERNGERTARHETN